LSEGAILTVKERGSNTFRGSGAKCGDAKDKPYLKNLTSIEFNNSKNALDWGWKFSKFRLTPIPNIKDPVPEILLKCISCKCKKGCGAACGCRKVGLKY
jgi:hypothetical protein